jgi:hypothetical protein
MSSGAMSLRCSISQIPLRKRVCDGGLPKPKTYSPDFFSPVMAPKRPLRGLDPFRTQSARHRVDHGTICGRSCANSGHYKPLCACVDRTFVNPNSSRQRPEKIRVLHARRSGAGCSPLSVWHRLDHTPHNSQAMPWVDEIFGINREISRLKSDP